MCPSKNALKMPNEVELRSVSVALVESLRNSLTILTSYIRLSLDDRCVGNTSPNLRYRNRPRKHESLS